MIYFQTIYFYFLWHHENKHVNTIWFGHKLLASKVGFGYKIPCKDFSNWCQVELLRKNFQKCCQCPASYAEKFKNFTTKLFPFSSNSLCKLLKFIFTFFSSLAKFWFMGKCIQHFENFWPDTVIIEKTSHYYLLFRKAAARRSTG